MSDGILLFTNDNGAGGASSGDYVKDEFRDTALPPSSNAGLSSTVSTNPLNQFFGNSVTPRWMAKTLWVKDLQIIENQGLWLDNQPTYKIIWHEDYPGVEGYCYGSPELSLGNEQRSVKIRKRNGVIGVGGVIRRVQWILKPTQEGEIATAVPYVDGVSGAAIDYGAYNASLTFLSGTQAETVFNAYTYSTSNQTRDIHDYRLVPDRNNNLVVYGVVVYFEIDGQGIDLPGGDVYLDKTKLSPAGASLAFPSGYSTFLGGKAGLYLQSNGLVGMTTSFVPEFSSVCTGASGTNLLSVAAGTGGSFPAGTALYVANGATHYLGMVSSQSGDVLTMNATLPFALSNTCRSLFQAGHTFNLGASLWVESYNYSPSFNQRNLDANSDRFSQPGTTPLLQFSDPQLRYRVTGFTMAGVIGASIAPQLSGATFGVAFPSASVGRFEFSGRACALDFEFMVGASASLNATIVIDGLAFRSIGEAVPGPGFIRRRIFTNAGMGWHQVNMTPAAGITQVALTRVIAYEPGLFNGPTLGALAEIPIYQTLIPRQSESATLTAFGNVQRLYADNLYFKDIDLVNPWSRAISTSVAGGVNVAPPGAGSGNILSFQYFGTRFAMISQGSGPSLSLNVDGLTVAGATYNQWIGTTYAQGFHTVTMTDRDGLTNISAVDYVSNVGEVKNLMALTPTDTEGNGVRLWNQPNEPKQARPGDMWQNGPVAYQRLFGGWQRVNSNQPCCVIGATAAQSIPNGVQTALTRGAVSYDPFGMVSTSGITTSITVPSDGHYLVCVGVRFDNNATGIRNVFLSTGIRQFTNTAVPSSASVGNVQCSALFYDLKKGNVIVPSTFQNSGGALNTSTSEIDSNFLFCQRIGP
jgi:hypothetical protein